MKEAGCGILSRGRVRLDVVECGSSGSHVYPGEKEG